jgi:hypothetical protein
VSKIKEMVRPNGAIPAGMPKRRRTLHDQIDEFEQLMGCPDYKRTRQEMGLSAAPASLTTGK